MFQIAKFSLGLIFIKDSSNIVSNILSPKYRNNFSNRSYAKKSKIVAEINNEDTTLNIYCDGSCLNNGKTFEVKALGIGVHIPTLNNGEFDLSLGLKDNDADSKLTSGQAEVLAAIFSLKQALKIVEKYPAKYKRVVINTDSDYLVSSMNKWIFKWISNNWMSVGSKKVLHREGFELLLSLTEQLKGVDVIWKHVPGHKGHIYNEKAHQLAHKASTEA
jgi:ribonuclease HI